MLHVISLELLVVAFLEMEGLVVLTHFRMLLIVVKEVYSLARVNRHNPLGDCMVLVQLQDNSNHILWCIDSIHTLLSSLHSKPHAQCSAANQEAGSCTHHSTYLPFPLHLLMPLCLHLLWAVLLAAIVGHLVAIPRVGHSGWEMVRIVLLRVCGWGCKDVWVGLLSLSSRICVGISHYMTGSGFINDLLERLGHI